MRVGTTTLSNPAVARLPWAYQSLLRLGTLVFVAFAGLVASSLGSSRRGTLPGQNGWLLVAMGACAVLLVATTRWLLEGLRNLRYRQTLVTARIEDVLDAVAREASQRPAIVQVAVATNALVAVPGLTRYHRPDCPLVTNKPAKPVSTTERAAAGLLPCGVCVP